MGKRWRYGLASVTDSQTTPTRLRQHNPSSVTPQYPSSVIRIPDDQLYVMTLLTPLIEYKKSISINESLIIDNYLTGIRMRCTQ